MSVEPGVIPALEVIELGDRATGATNGAPPTPEVDQSHKKFWEYPARTPVAYWTRVWCCDDCSAHFSERDLAETDYAYAKCSACSEGQVIDTTDRPVCCVDARWEIESFESRLPCPKCQEDWKDPMDYVVGIVLEDGSIFTPGNDN